MKFYEVYKNLLEDVRYKCDYIVSPRGKNIFEKLNVSFSIDPDTCLYKNKIRGSQQKYIAREFIWYLAGDCSTTFISKTAPFWNKLKNLHNGYINSNYGYLIFHDPPKYNKNGKSKYDYPSQWYYARQCLIDDKNSRQAILHFNKPNHQFVNNKDFPCTLYGIFHIRNNTLYFSIFMRSSDIILGLPTDVAFFCLLHRLMFVELREFYPNLKIGKYFHFSNSLHLYVDNLLLTDNMLEYPFEPASYPLLDESFFKYGDNNMMLNADVRNVITNIYNNTREYSTNVFYSWLYEKAILEEN